jgi:outer membrane protein
MRLLKMMSSMAVIGMLMAGPAFAQAAPPPQTPPPQTPPPAGQKPATPPAEQKPVQPPAQPPKPFPEGAKVGYIDIQLIASNSTEGKAAAQKIKAWDEAKTKELQAKNKQAQDIQTKLAQSSGILSESARSQSEKELQKLQRELQAMQEDAQQERQDLTAKLQGEFQDKLNPVIEQVATEKNLHLVFSVRDSPIVWAYSGVDLTAEVLKRFDSSKPAPKK